MGAFAIYSKSVYVTENNIILEEKEYAIQTQSNIQNPEHTVQACNGVFPCAGARANAGSERLG
jgi:hypothetical protein